MPSNNVRYRNWKARTEQRRRILRECDGRACPFCGRPMDASLDWWTDPADGRRKRHPYSIEVDEIVPVSRGGSPIDPRNLQGAHRICNQRAGAKTRAPKPMGDVTGGGLPASREW